MSVGIDTLTAAPLVLDVGGRPLRLAPLSLADLGVLQAWVNAQLPDPIAVARRLAEGFPAEVQMELLRDAYRDARTSRRAAPLGTPEAEAILTTPAGMEEVFALALGKYQPETARDDVQALMARLTSGDIDGLMAHLFGDDRAAAAPDPKGPGVASPTPTPASNGETSSFASVGFPTGSAPPRSAR